MNCLITQMSVRQMLYLNMKLFHTSDRIIRKPDLSAGRSNADFGRGFYLTPDERFAGSWARERTSSDIFVNVYELIEAELKIKRFEHEKAWFSYIFNNRRGHADSLKDHDVIIGPIANDTLFETYGIITSGLLTEDQALELLAIGPEFIQVAIKTDAAAGRLEWKEAYVLSASEMTAARNKYDEENELFSMEFAQKLDSYNIGE